MPKTECVYILTNKSKTILYIGVTSNLKTRLLQHSYEPKGFVKRYSVQHLVYYEIISGMLNAIHREKKLKGWKRFRKDELIDSTNPERRFLNAEIL